MFLQRVALEPVPQYAVVDEQVVAHVLRGLTASGELKHELSGAFRQLEVRQPALAECLGEELAEVERASTQTLTYFLFLVIYLCFEHAFGERLGTVTAAELDATIERLLTDGELRQQALREGSYSEDVVALGQPALVRLIDSELSRALAAGGQRDAAPVFEALLIEILALTEAVSPAA